jgi:predicted MPP superfamily phosphohydrolase
MVTSRSKTILIEQLHEVSIDTTYLLPVESNTLPISRPKRNPLDPPRLAYAPSWFALGAAATALGGLGLRQLGWGAVASASVLGAAGMAYMTRFEPANPTLEHITLRLPTLPPELDGLRIGQITDTHLGTRYSARNLIWAIEQIERVQPELLVITGDMAGKRKSIPEIATLYGRLRAPLGVYAVPGNHDYWEGLADINAALSVVGIPLLLNQSRRLRWNGVDFWLAGVDDIWDGCLDFAAACAEIPIDAFTILLAHSPDVANEAAEHGFALQISGHTHGGHLRLPGLGPFARPRFGMRYVMGHYQIGAMQLYVSRGLGGEPLRLFCRPEATIFTLRCG